MKLLRVQQQLSGEMAEADRAAALNLVADAKEALATSQASLKR